MDLYSSDEPIIACSTGNQSNSAIAVIRISGFHELSSFQKSFSIDLKSIKARQVYYCSLKEEGTVVDYIVLTFFKAPFSYNGENILELSVHGNTINVNKIIELFVKNYSLRIAYPGEFTYRALKNGKLNLSQIEGLDLLLNANSEFILNQGFSLMNGSLQESYKKLYSAYLNHKSSLELSIDFLDDVGEEEATRQLQESFSILKHALQGLQKRILNNDLNLINPQIALVGLPNAGKSSLFNALLGEDRSIVTSMAGTTRDYISENIKISGVNYKLIDTAGVRESSDEIEVEGIKRAVTLAKKSFYKILVVNPFEHNADFYKFIQDIDFDLVVFSHSDQESFKNRLGKVLEEEFFKKRISGPMGANATGSIGPKNDGPMGAKATGPIEPKTSGPMGAKTIGSIGANLKSLGSAELNKIYSLVNEKYSSIINKNPIVLDRHKQIIFNSVELCTQYQELLESEHDVSIISAELANIGHCISELIGIVSPDDVLHNIFDNFCIGK